MKTSEFIEKAKQLEFVDMVLNNNDYTIIVRSFKGDLMRLREHEYFMIDNVYPAFDNLNDNQKDLLMDVAIDYLKTPISERKDKTIEEKAREYIQEYVSDHLSFESARDFLECCNLYITDNGDFKNLIMHSYEEIAEYSKIYDWYHEHSTEFIKIWLEVSEYEN